MKKTLLIAAPIALSLYGCATTQSETSDPQTVKSDSSVSVNAHLVRNGYQKLHSETGGQVIIPDEAQHVLTVDPKPTVLYVEKEQADNTSPNSTGSITNASGAKAEKNKPLPEKVWEKLCAGKILNQEERDILDDNPLPYGWKKPCDPVWNGEK